MNLDSIHRLIEETQIFQRQQPSPKPPGAMAAPASSPGETRHPCWPLHGLQARSTCAHWRSPSEWDLCEELRQRELQEVKARAAQMEKTMRWWSDCTANWREKWSKVRAERNSAREEGRQLRVKLEMTMKELSSLKKKQSAPQAPGTREAELSRDLKTSTLLGASRVRRGQSQVRGQEEDLVIDTLRIDEELKLNLDHPDAFKDGGSENSTVKSGLRLQEENLPLENEVPEVSALQGQLDEFQKVLRKERETRSSLEKEIVRLETALSVWKLRYEELKESKAETVNELNIPYGQHKNDVEEMSSGTKEGFKSQISKDRVVCELQTEEPLELQLAYHTLSRQCEAKIAELREANNRMEQNEAEVKKLRFQVEELTQRLGQKEAELDVSLHQIHKLQRALDEQKEMNENLETELRHLQNR
ncbi:PREDICTED: coiled-coil domain-containing protein 102B [Condylura cristata]|uniref:coiled-coil domain-containing protein 102B n=1 Tax=Condylura cristata TaxID=143302 RepID=UPI0006433033|nr:PREDICTED: coiled-coil domain-containing protein 102B [Condylura cristata]